MALQQKAPRRRVESSLCSSALPLKLLQPRLLRLSEARLRQRISLLPQASSPTRPSSALQAGANSLTRCRPREERLPHMTGANDQRHHAEVIELLSRPQKKPVHE